MTSTSVGWVLLDGQDPDAAVLDNDAFDIQSGSNVTEGDTSPHTAAARGAQTIATASGHKVDSVRVTWTEDVEAGSPALLKSLADLGFDDVQSVTLSRAAQAWGIETGRASEHAKTGLCILEPNAATIMIIATGAGTVRTAVMDGRESAEDLVEWLRTVFRKDGWLPESLYLIGAHADLDDVAQPVADALPIPVSDSADTQLALARGAALARVAAPDTGSVPVAEAVAEKPWRVPRPKKSTAPAEAEALDTAVTQVIATPRVAPPKRDRPWVLAHTKKLTIGAAAVAVVGAALSLAAGSALNVETVSTQAADSTGSGASVTSASVHTVPAPAPALPVPELQPMAAEPPAVPPPPPETLSLPAEPAAVVAPEPLAAPSHHPAMPAAPPLPVPVAAPDVAPPVAAPLAVPAAAPLAAAPAVVPPPAAPALVAPPPVAAAPVAPPPAAPAPVVPPAPVDGAEPPPPDPIQQSLSPLFSGLP